MILYTMRQDAEFKKILFSGFAAMSAGAEGEDAAKEVQKSLKEYTHTQYPYLKQKAEEEEKKLRDVLKSETNQAFKISRMPETWNKRKR